MNTASQLSCDVLIIGSGAAGLSVALRLAETRNVIVLSKGPLAEGSTFYAQGGIAAVFDESDSIDLHVDDTLVAGAGICDPHAVRFVASHARHCVEWLIDQGVLFDTQPDAQGNECYHLTREGGHSHRRILHAADATGKTVETTLVSLAKNHPGIRIMEHRSAVDLITTEHTGQPGSRQVQGAWILDNQSGDIQPCRAKVVVLATGGAARVYPYTTNPEIACGDGVAMAWRAGCRVANLEFNQFHPTALHHYGARNFLLTEALRGEGAWLTRPDGTRFMPDIDPRAELAPRDIVARAIDHEIKRLGAECMYLDISHKPAEFIRHHFPTIYEKLLGLGIDITREPIPIVPAAHYTCGGVMVDDNGQTDLPGLYAVGEVSYTGLHGANRLASNSLLECVVYGWSAAEDIRQRIDDIAPPPALPGWQQGSELSPNEDAVILHNSQELRQCMWDYMGIVRTTSRLERAVRRITLLEQEYSRYYSHRHMTPRLLELRNLIQVAGLMVACAQARKESRGLHFTLDYPRAQAQSGPTILAPENYINR
ncbi:L-aspartate oxidase [Shimwellia blattae]|uniref:L-aspartate oxidase n=1 Tax=Shimwellia blattae (strain ATCC 29907 / DSM 4481 / JCM 1650 / NBRC 105725 / CDC 9005-74) TaxID=630626 RepID=I2B6E5_SHIBC|nr:L-aspartate oxidase [Shimwellia blattae]AFJ46099.1 L-aspartate oxidase [Shimwellia blattae DSM 4481 = NBRC 105725]GAB81256.1 L-aspartate oxidase [Shimwellia blattae DSM 4481 = NBRC 105725]VDY63572.1 L-aspartate oxidase [Shimwellia blattae]VEC21599.1 L-aspartate oxidase [Shimwellia blattae]